MQDNSSTFLQDVLSNAVLALFVLMLIALVQIGNRGLLRISELSSGATTGTGSSLQGQSKPEQEGDTDGPGQVDLTEVEILWIAIESPAHQLGIEYQSDSLTATSNMISLGDSRSDERATQALFRNSGPLDNGRFIIGNLSADTPVTLTVFADALFVLQEKVDVSAARPVITLQRDEGSGLSLVIASE